MPSAAFPIVDKPRDATPPVSPVAAATDVSSRRAPDDRELVLTELTVTEFDHFVSFRARDAAGAEILLQYTSDQVWLDEFGTWQIRPAQMPFYAWRSAPRRRRPASIGPALSLALTEAATGRRRE